MAEERTTLFSDFSGSSTAEWEAAIEKALKGKDYEETLIWKTLEGMVVKPYYRAEDQPENQSSPGQYPYTRGAYATSNDWEICQEFDATSDQANARIKTGLMNGATAVWINHVDSNLTSVMEGVMPEHISTHFGHSANADQLANDFLALLNDRNLSSDAIRASFGFDPITVLASTGNWNRSASDERNTGAATAKILSEANAPLMHAITASSLAYHMAGAGWSQEIGATLAHAHEYLVWLLESGLPIDEAAARIRFDLAIGSDYFAEIAKVRALRQQWARIVEQYQPEHDCSMLAWVRGITSPATMASADENVNLLRATSQAMSAVIGGCQAVTTIPFRALTDANNPHSERLAVSSQLVLKEEAHLNKVCDPAGGSWYIDALTDQIAQASWKTFQEIEASGGIIVALSDGSLASEIAKTADAREAAITSGKQTILSVNKFPNPEDEEATVNEYWQPKRAENPIIEPLPTRRYSANLEAQRWTKEETA